MLHSPNRNTLIKSVSDEHKELWHRWQSDQMSHPQLKEHMKNDHVFARYVALQSRTNN